MTEDDTRGLLIDILRAENWDLGECCVVAEGVVFGSKQVGATFAKKHSKELISIQGPVTGGALRIRLEEGGVPGAAWALTSLPS